MCSQKRGGSGKRAAVVTVALAGFFAAPAAWAGDREAADRLFEEALVLSDAGNWDAACPKFKESNDADPSVGALLNMASCSERAGDLMLARQQYAEAATRNEATADIMRRDAVKQQLADAGAALELRIPRVQVRVQPADAKISIDGAPAVVEPQGIAVKPGKHTLHIEASGFVSQEVALDVIEKQRLPLDIKLQAAREEPKPKPAPPPPVEAGSSLLIPGIVVSALGLAVGGAGGGLLGVASSNASEIADLCGDDPEPPACFGTEADAAEATRLSDSGRPMEIAGGVLVGVGGATLITGVILLAVTGSQNDDAKAGVAFAPVVSEETLGFSVVGRF